MHHKIEIKNQTHIKTQLNYFDYINTGTIERISRDVEVVQKVASDIPTYYL